MSAPSPTPQPHTPAVSYRFKTEAGKLDLIRVLTENPDHSAFVLRVGRPRDYLLMFPAHIAGTETELLDQVGVRRNFEGLEDWEVWGFDDLDSDTVGQLYRLARILGLLAKLEKRAATEKFEVKVTGF